VERNGNAVTELPAGIELGGMGHEGASATPLRKTTSEIGLPCQLACKQQRADRVEACPSTDWMKSRPASGLGCRHSGRH